MIVREHENKFVMIEQDDHAHISGQLLHNWDRNLFRGHQLWKSVEYAVQNHDYGWKRIDKQPFWNDAKRAPYTFVDFPVLPKTVFYKHGIEEVVKKNAYAGLLCSRHYTNFLLDDKSEEAREFVDSEQRRQEQISKTLKIDDHLYDFHYELLQFCDSLSLYICLNEPGAAKPDEHPFFRHGIPAPSLLFEQNKMMARWKDEKTIELENFPFSAPFSVTIKYKNVLKTTISEKGLSNSFDDAPLKEYNVLLSEIT
ncbi:DUF3891 family protein [Virgibacillus ihumii]|uniref:DUF3891 family protein n=1 Tax=Virgibacillus ihumii TaxID=2686091 RepID=UPI00157C40CC|nr:DUF3891 family protein [Virgibacillus ihumii]